MNKSFQKVFHLKFQGQKNKSVQRSKKMIEKGKIKKFIKKRYKK